MRDLPKGTQILVPKSELADKNVDIFIDSLNVKIFENKVVCTIVRHTDTINSNCKALGKGWNK